MNTHTSKRLRASNSARLALLLIATALLILRSAQAALYLTEPFSYTAGALGTSPANGTWDTTVKSAINVTATGLTGPAGFPTAGGNDVTLGNTGHNQQNFNTFTSSGTIVSGTVYACFLLKVTSTGSMRSADTLTSPNYNDGFTLALQNAASAASPFCSIRLINSSGCKIGLAKNGAAGSYRTAALTVNTTYMVVEKYDFSTAPNTASFWILSTYQGTEAGAGAADVTINTGTDLAPGAAGLGQCYLSDAAGGTFQVDELRIASTWQEATGGAAAGPAAKLAFTTQPANAAPGATMNAVVVQAQDAGGLAVATNNVPITLTLTGGSGTLSGTLTQNTDASGKATFGNLSIDLAGTGKQLTATASGIGAGLTSSVSSNFSIVAPSVGAKLAFTTQPASALVNATLGAVVVQVQDASSVSVASNGVPVTLTLSSGSGTLNGTLTQNTDGTGKATFSNLSVDTVGTGKQLTATASGIGAGLTSALSGTFAITNTVVTGTNGVPIITQTLVAPGGFVVLASNTVPNVLGQVLGSPSRSLPMNSWVLCAAHNFDATGNFAWTNPISPALPMAFYRLNVGSTVTKLTPPSITVSPVSQTVSPGATATFSVTATGPLLQYLWYFNNQPISGATASVLTISNAQAGNIGSYYAVVANPAGAGTSATATLGVGNVGPTITMQPQDETVVAGANASFRVVANGTAPLGYQWYFNTNTFLPDATNAQLTLNGVATNQAGKYRVIVANNFGSLGSTNATLTINPAPALPSETNMIGFATVANVTGGSFGGNTLVVYATNYVSLSNYVRRAEALIINVQGAITNTESYCYIYGNNKTIVGEGTNAAFYGCLRINATNVIIQNLFITCSTNTGFSYMTNDCITIDGGSKGTGKNIWIDHCTLFDATDGSIDITKGADYITVSWCRFSYLPPTPTDIHHYVDLIGSSDSDSGTPFHVTFHHNWYDTNCLERMPSVRFGRVHCFNNYYTCAGNNYCIRTRISAQVLVENNYFQGVQNPWELLTTSGTTGLLKAIGNNVTGPGDTSAGVTWLSGWYPGQSLVPGNDPLSDFTPVPYAYTPQPAATVLTEVPTFSGSGKYPYVP